jgi:hypothetical protein
LSISILFFSEQGAYCATARTTHGLVKGRQGCRGDRPRRSGTIQTQGKIIKLGRRTSYAEGFVCDRTGNLAVHATATFSMIGEAVRAK